MADRVADVVAIGSMAKAPDDQVVNLRLPQAWLDRAEAIAKVMQEDDALRAQGRISRAMALRLAVLRGIEALEQTYGIDETGKRRKR